MIMPLFQISPLVGIEFNLSPSISVFAQGVFHIMSPEDYTDNYFGDDSRGIWYYSDQKIQSGPSFSGGVKYYLW
jgi:hypothetical protein